MININAHIDTDNEQLKKSAQLFWKCSLDIVNKHLADSGTDIRFVLKEKPVDTKESLID